jgi:pimeloyl-ACP methyl ester carboxylesterase
MTPEDPSDLLVTVNPEDGFGASQELHHITAPTLVVAGEQDRYNKPELFRETTARIPNARLRLYRGKGHASMRTYEPAVRDVLRFLTAGDPSASAP